MIRAQMIRSPRLGLGIRFGKRYATTSVHGAGKKRLVILGSGWGGYETLKGVSKLHDYDVTLVSPSTYFNFTPLLSSAAVGAIEFRSAIESVRKFSPRANIYEAWCDEIDFDAKTLRCTPSGPAWTEYRPDSNERPSNVPLESRAAFNLEYDKLVIAVGAYAQTFGTAGVREHGIFLKDIRDARRIRNRLVECFEEASLPHTTEARRRQLLTFCIVGGGPTGVEFCANLHNLLAGDVREHYPELAPLARIKLFDVAPHILTMFDKAIVGYAERTLAKERVELLTGHHVERVEAGKVFTKEEGEIPFGMLVWSTGLAPSPLLLSMNGEQVKKHPKTGSLITDNHLHLLRRIPSAGGTSDMVPDANVWAIGDAAMIEGVMLPATAQVASQKAHYVVRELKKPQGKPFKFRYLGSLAYLGDTSAVYDRTTTTSGPRVKQGGRLAWLLWHSAYLTMTMSPRNKILVPMYQFLSRIFGRDLSRF